MRTVRLSRTPTRTMRTGVRRSAGPRNNPVELAVVGWIALGGAVVLAGIGVWQISRLVVGIQNIH